MKSLAALLTAILLLALSSQRADAQFSVKRSVTTNTLETRTRPDSIVVADDITNKYFSKAKYLAEKRRIRNERNTIEFNAGMFISQTAFENWASGGDNTFSGRSTIFFHHLYKKEILTIDYRIEAKYGMNIIQNTYFKNEDEFKFNFLMTWKMHKFWSYAATTSFRSQFAPGYKSRTDETLISDFMAPATWDISVGFNYKKEGSPFSITLSPVGGNVLFVLNDELSARGINGITPGDRVKGKVGPSVKIDFDKTFGKNDLFRYRSQFYTFTNFKTAPLARWENTFDIRATKLLTTSLYWLGIYDVDATTPYKSDFQLQYSISVGLSYWFKNKK